MCGDVQRKIAVAGPAGGYVCQTYVWREIKVLQATTVMDHIIAAGVNIIDAGIGTTAGVRVVCYDVIARAEKKSGGSHPADGNQVYCVAMVSANERRASQG